MSKKRSELGYKIAKFLVGGIFCLIYHPKVVNKENIPLKGPVIICGNHRHLYDQCPVIMSTKRTIFYMAKEEHFDGKFGWFFKWVGCIRVDRRIHDKIAKEEAIDVLKNGGVLGIFPEGTRNKSEKALLPFKMGTVSLAQKTGALIVPFASTGDYKWNNKNLSFIFGEPFMVSKDEDLVEANKKLESIVMDLLIKSQNPYNK